MLARKGGGFGLVMLVVVLAVVLLLVSRAWERSGGAAAALDPSSAPRPAEREALDALPNLDEMRDATSEHADAVQDALDATQQ